MTKVNPMTKDEYIRHLESEIQCLKYQVLKKENDNLLLLLEQSNVSRDKLQKKLQIAKDALRLFCGETVSYHSSSKVDARHARKALAQIED